MRGTTMLVLTPVVVAACNSYGSSTTGTTVDAGACNGVGGNSTVDDQHTHSICIPTADLTAPPANGQTYTSSESSSHTHTLTLTSAQLTSIQSEQTIIVTSASSPNPLDNNTVHTHNWTLHKV